MAYYREEEFEDIGKLLDGATVPTTLAALLFILLILFILI